MKFFLLSLILLYSLAANAQMKEGRVVYERNFQLPQRMLNMNPDLAKQIPKSRTDQFELLFANNQSLWQYLPGISSDGDPNSFAGGGMVLRFAGGGNEVSYYDFTKGIRVDEREVADKNFVVTDSIKKLNWKLSDETKTVLTYTVHKATAQNIETRMRMIMENRKMKREPVEDTTTVIAWYTTDIPVAAGPDFQGQLPGLILEMDVNNGRTVYKAIEVSPKVNKNKIRQPKNGKKLTAAEFITEREKIMEEMQKNMPEGMQMRIRD